MMVMRLILALISTQAMACEVFIRQQENFYHIPQDLLKAVSLVESGRKIKTGTRVAWPWTINVNGRGYVYESKQQAINAVRQFQKNGETSIDVGCMQVNLKHHPNAFRNLEDAFDPQINVSYAALYLNNLKKQLGSWKTAVAHYHSATPLYHQPYREMVHKQWASLRQSGGNQTAILQDLAYVAQTPVATSGIHPLMQQQAKLQQTVSQQAKSLQQQAKSVQQQAKSVQQPIQNSKPTLPVQPSPPGKFFPVKGQPKEIKPYARVNYRKFYPVASNNHSGFMPVR